MRNPYSKPLLKIYETARKFVDDFELTVVGLVNSEDIHYQPLRRHYKTNVVQVNDNPLSFNNSDALAEANKTLTETYEKLNADVLAILEDIPQVSFRIRFNEPKANKVGMLETYKSYTFTANMEGFLAKYDKLVAKVSELPKIIEDYEKSIYQPDDFPQKTDSETKPNKVVVYCLTYDAMSGRLSINDKEVYKCNLDSKLDKALSSAFNAPDEAVTTSGNLASAISAIRAPEGLKRLMFRTSKGSFRIHPDVTDEDLRQNKLDKETIDAEFQKLSK